MIAYAWDFKSVLAVIVALLIVAVLAYRLLNRDPGVWRTRFGFFVERDRYTPDDELGVPDDDDTQEWPQG